MKFSVKKMSENDARQILQWRYDPPYDFYNTELTSDAIKEMMDNPYFVILDHKDEMVGFYCTGSSAQVPIGSLFGAYLEDCLDIGIGMKPELTGKGYGTEFFTFILCLLQDLFQDTPLRLTVATFNQRAIRLYENLGFSKRMEFQRGSTVFITMVKNPL